MRLLRDGALHFCLNLSDEQISRFHTYYEALRQWSKRFNLTSILEYDDVQIKHFLDSLSVYVTFPKQQDFPYLLIDIGSGGGFPGLPLKIALPQLKVILLESNHKKAVFLKHVIQMLEMEDAEVLCARAEEVAHMADFREKFDLVVTRGLAKMATLCELTMPFCKKGGRLIAQKTMNIDSELDQASKAITLMGGDKAQIVPIVVPGIEEARSLVVIEKVSNTPSKFPRRNGMPKSNPILTV